MALSISYGIRKKDLDDYKYFTISFKKEQDRQIFYFGESSYHSVLRPLNYVEKMIKRRIRETVLLDYNQTGPLAFIFNIINKITVFEANGIDYQTFLAEPHLIFDIVTQAKKILNKLSTLYNVMDLKNYRNLVQSYYRRNQRLYREQTIYLNSFLYGLRKDYPTIFEKSPYIIENTLSDCILDIFGVKIKFRPPNNSTDCGNSRKEWFKSITKYKYNLRSVKKIKQSCLRYMDFMKLDGRIERKYASEINEKVVIHNRFESTDRYVSSPSSSSSSENQRKRKMSSDEDQDDLKKQKLMTDIDLLISMKKYKHDNPNVGKSNFHSLLTSFAESLFENDDGSKKIATTVCEGNRDIDGDIDDDDDDDIDDDTDEYDVINKCLKGNVDMQDELEEEEEISTYTIYKSPEDFYKNFPVIEIRGKDDY